MKKILFLYFFFIGGISFSQTLSWLNEIRYSGYNYAHGIGTDSLNNVYVCGNYSSDEDEGIFVSKYDFTGALVWSDVKAGALYVESMFSDAVGNSYITGTSVGTGNTVTFGGYSFTSMSTHDMFVVKYNSAGLVLWLRHFIRATPVKLEMSPAGILYLAGDCAVNTSFDSLIFSGSFIIKMDSAGNCLSGFEPPGPSMDIAVDSVGNIYQLTNPSSGPSEIKKYDINTNILWSRNANYGGKLTTDNKGNSYLLGYFDGSCAWGSTILNSSYGTGCLDVYIGKIDSLGNYKWAIKPPSATFFLGFEIKDTNVYATGYTGYPSAPYSSRQLIVAQSDQAGTPFVIQDVTSGYSGTAICKDAGGAIYIAGSACDEAPSAFVAKISNSEVGISDLSNNPIFQLYPNPATENITITLNNVTAGSYLKISNALGQVVYQKKLENGITDHTISLNAYPKGLYVAELITESEHSVRKFIVN